MVTSIRGRVIGVLILGIPLSSKNSRSNSTYTKIWYQSDQSESLRSIEEWGMTSPLCNLVKEESDIDLWQIMLHMKSLCFIAILWIFASTLVIMPVVTNKMMNDITTGMCVWQTVVLIIGIYHWSSSSRVLTIVNQSSEVRGQGGVGNNDQHDPSI